MQIKTTGEHLSHGGSLFISGPTLFHKEDIAVQQHFPTTIPKETDSYALDLD